LFTFFKNYSKFYTEKSILTANDVVQWKKKSNSYNFKKLPETVILTPNTNFVKGFKKIFYKKIQGISGKNYILNSDYLLSFNFGNGASAIISHMEELQSLGVSKFIFIGFAGMLSPLEEGDFYLVSKAFSVTGTSFYYSNKEVLESDNPLTKEISKQFTLVKATCVSVDMPFRETKSFIANYVKKGVHLIDMETASIIAFSKFYRVECACILIASDSFQNLEWQAPKNTANLSTVVDNLIKKIIA